MRMSFRNITKRFFEVESYYERIFKALDIMKNTAKAQEKSEKVATISEKPTE